ncbi:MAG: sugar kinase, partial [Spirochaetaceae bacterium]|nr:sugar kinase [Spirochaetaceae bacterium]
MPKTVLCADAGSSSIKLALIETAGSLMNLRVLAFVREAYNRGGAPAVLEAAFYQGIQKLLAQTPLPTTHYPPHIDAVCISACGPTLFPITETGEALSPLWWYSPACRETPLQSFFLPYILWQRRNLPDEYRRTNKYFSPQEYLSWKLGASPAAVLPTEQYTPYYWDKKELKTADIPPERFFYYVPLGKKIGAVSAEAALRTGIPAGTPIAAGGVDFIMALYGSGVVQPGMTLDRAGSSEGINICLAEPPPQSLLPILNERGLRILPHAVSGYWNLSAVIPESGSLFDRYRAGNSLEDYPYDDLLKALLPDCANSDDSPSAPPQTNSEYGALPENTIAEGRRVLQMLADKVCAALDTLKDVGYPVTEMVICGGQAKS